MNLARDKSPASPISVARHVAAIVLVLAWAAAPAPAHRGHAFGNPFHEVSLEEACKLAEQEFKLVYVYVTAPNGQVCKYLERPTWSDWRAIDLLIREMVAVRLDGGRDAEQLRRYKLGKLPVMLLLNPDGSQRRRLAGELSAEQLKRELVADLSGADCVARVRKTVAAGGGEDPLARERLAETLTRQGSHAEALEEYLWCLEVGLRRNIPYATARRRLLLKGFVALAEQYPPARETLEQRRAAMEQALRDKKGTANLARDLAELNSCLGDEARTLALFDELPPRSKARYVLFDRVFEQLVEHRRYDELLAFVDPLQTFSQEKRMALMRKALWDDSPEARYERGNRAFAIARGAALVEALAGLGRIDEARTLIDKILKFDGRPEARTLLEQHLRRAECTELVRYLQPKPPTSQPAQDP